MPQNIWINWAFEASKHVYFPSKVEKNNASESEDEVEHFLDYLLKEVEQHQQHLVAGCCFHLYYDYEQLYDWDDDPQ